MRLIRIKLEFETKFYVKFKKPKPTFFATLLKKKVSIKLKE